MSRRGVAAALDKICTMPQADYVAYLAKLAAQAATTGTGPGVQRQDQAACGQAVVDAANALLAQPQASRLTMSQATRDILRAGSCSSREISS